MPACPMQDAMREASRIVLKDFELRTDATLRPVIALLDRPNNTLNIKY
jgi:hypothetical protein